MYGFGGSKIADFECAVLHDENVGAFEIAVHDVLFVEVLECLQNLCGHSSGLPLLEVVAFEDVLPETAPLRVFQDYFYLFAVARNVEAVILDDVLVVQLLKDSDLCLERVYLFYCLFAGLCGDFHNFEGVFLAVEFVYAAVYLTVGATADQLLSLVDAVQRQNCFLLAPHLARIDCTAAHYYKMFSITPHTHHPSRQSFTPKMVHKWGE